MSEPQAAPEASPSGGSNPSIIEILTSVANEREAKESGAAPEATQTSQAAPAKATPKGFIDPLSDELFADDKLSTPEGVKAARELLQAELKAAKEIRQKAHNARAEAERRVGRFKGTKAEVLAEKHAVQAQANMLRAELAEIQSGDPARFTNAIARLANKSDDPIGFWREVATHIASGKRPEPVASPELQQLKAELAELKTGLRGRDDAAQEQALDQQIMAIRQWQIEETKSYADLPMIANLAHEQPALVDARLVEVRRQHHERTGHPLDLRSAADIVEKEIRSHFELLQRAGNPRGAMNGEREAAAPVAGLARQPERQIANPESATSAPFQNRSVSAIPASLAGVSSPNGRQLTPKEEKAAVTAELEKMGLFAALGM